MKQIFAIIIVLLAATITAHAQYDKCASSANLITIYYTAEAHTSYGFGFELGTQGVETRLGGFAGFQFQKMEDYYFKKDSASFNLRASLYLKGSYRLNGEPSGKGSLFLIACPSLSVQTGVDYKAGFRGVLPLSETKAIGIEPAYSFRYKTVSLNVLVIF